MQTVKERNVVDEFTEEQFAELDGYVEKCRGGSGAAIRALTRAQEIFGYLPPVVQKRVAAGLGISPSEIYGIATFYSFFTLAPKGKNKICSCQGTACYVRGGKQALDEFRKTLGIDVGGTTEDREFSLDTVRCMGACALAPVVRVGDDVHRRVMAKKVPELVRKYGAAGGGVDNGQA